MERNFDKEGLDYLRLAAWDVQRQEQTQEVKLPGDLPDAGRILGCWGQCILRSKEWRSGGMNATGGVMTWTLYAPEDGSAPRCIEAWVPFQMKWNFPQSDREGLMNITCTLRAADARIVSARKLMIRVSVSALGIAVDHTQAEVFIPRDVPEDVMLLRRTYPVKLPVEAGEKLLQLDEELTLQGMQEGWKLVRYCLEPQLQEQRLVSDRLVFRGAAKLRLLLAGEGGGLRAEDLEVPFSTFADLEKEYEGDASVQIHLALTGLETELAPEGRLRLKASFAAQYIIWNRVMLDVVEDAYSNRRDVGLQQQILTLPALLDQRTESCSGEERVFQNGVQIVDTFAMTDCPGVENNGDETVLRVPVNVQLLYQDGSGMMQGTAVQVECRCALPSDEDSKTLVTVRSGASLHTGLSGEGMTVRCEPELEIRTVSGQGMPMVTGLELGDLKPQDPDRPSLILRRCSGMPLWEMAKASGSSVEAIRTANALEAEPEMGRMILIPVQ